MEELRPHIQQLGAVIGDGIQVALTRKSELARDKLNTALDAIRTPEGAPLVNIIEAGKNAHDDVIDHIKVRGGLATLLDLLEGLGRVGTYRAGFSRAPWAMSAEEWDATTLARRERERAYADACGE